MTAPITSAMVPVYDGEAAIGFIIRHGPAGVECLTAESRSLGLFKTVDAAATMLWLRARNQPTTTPVCGNPQVKDR
jgi:hypothetical protein